MISPGIATAGKSLTPVSVSAAGGANFLFLFLHPGKAIIKAIRAINILFLILKFFLLMLTFLNPWIEGAVNETFEHITKIIKIS